MSVAAVTFAVSEGLPVMFVTEDTTRADPATIRALYMTAIRCGARALCVCDTVGHSTPDGARSALARLARTSGSGPGRHQLARGD